MVAAAGMGKVHTGGGDVSTGGSKNWEHGVVCFGESESNKIDVAVSFTQESSSADY